MIQRRSLRSFGGWLALAAVWLQLALSYGHIHTDELLPKKPANHTVLLSQSMDGSSPVAPQGDPSDKACEICATMALAGSLVFPDPVVLPVPVALSEPATLAVARDFALAANPYILFRTRAPPIA